MPEITLEEAVKVLRDNLREDEGLYYSYQSNIAVQFQDEMYRSGLDYDMETIHFVSNNAARNFLNLLIKDSK